MFELNGVELDFDLLDADISDAYNAALETLSKQNSEIGQMEKPDNDKVRLMCATVRTMFDDAFGTGTGEKVCGERPNLGVHLKAFEALVLEGTKQKEDFDKEAKKMTTMMSGNREQRRAADKAAGK